MKLTDYLIKQLTDIIEVYRKYLWKTYGVCLLLATIFIIIITGLYAISSFDKSFLLPKSIRGIVQFIYAKYTGPDGYCDVDIAKMVLLFFASVFSLSIAETERKTANGKDPVPVNVEFNFPQTTQLFFTLIVTMIIDYGLSKAYWFTAEVGGTYSYWIMEIIFEVRVFIPYFLFPFVLYNIKYKTYPTPNLKMLGFLFITFWLFEEISLGLLTMYRIIVCDGISAPFNGQTVLVIQSILSIPVLAFWFPGLYSILYNALQIIELPQSLNDEDCDNISDDEVQ